MMSNEREHKYIYNMFYNERRKLCRLLDDGDKWKELAGHMQFGISTIHVSIFTLLLLDLGIFFIRMVILIGLMGAFIYGARK